MLWAQHRACDKPRLLASACNRIACPVAGGPVAAHAAAAKICFDGGIVKAGALIASIPNTGASKLPPDSPGDRRARPCGVAATVALGVDADATARGSLSESYGPSGTGGTARPSHRRAAQARWLSTNRRDFLRQPGGDARREAARP